MNFKALRRNDNQTTFRRRATKYFMDFMGNFWKGVQDTFGQIYLSGQDCGQNPAGETNPYHCNNNTLKFLMLLLH